METKLILYHGSNCNFDTIDLQKSKDKRDFGKGFYTTTLPEQADENEAINRLRSSKINDQISIHTSAALSRLKIIRKHQK